MKILTLITTLALCLPAPAQTINSLDLPSIDGDVPVSYNQWLASSFLAGPGAETMLVQDISIRVDCLQPNANAFVAITGSLNGKPDLNDVRVRGDVVDLTTKVRINTIFTMTLEPDSALGPAKLLPDQEYWIVFGFTAPDYESDLPAGLFHWSYAVSDIGLGSVDGWEFGSMTATGNTAGQNWSTEATTPSSFGITLVPVPEPGGLGLLSGAALLLLRRRRRGPGTI